MISRILLGLGACAILSTAACALWAAIGLGLERRRDRHMVEDVLWEAEVCRDPVLRRIYLPEDQT